LQTWLPQAILVSDLLISKKSSPLKPLPRDLRGEDLKKIYQSETRIACEDHVFKQIGTKSNL
jgi:hypothetical protein